MTGELRNKLLPFKGNIITDKAKPLRFRQYQDISDIPNAAMLPEGTEVCTISNGDCRLILDVEGKDTIFVTDPDADEIEDDDVYTDPADFPDVLKALFRGELGDMCSDGDYMYGGKQYYIGLDSVSEYRCVFEKKDPKTGNYEEIETQYLYDIIGKDLGCTDKDTLKAVMTDVFRQFVDEWNVHLKTGKVSWNF